MIKYLVFILALTRILNILEEISLQNRQILENLRVDTVSAPVVLPAGLTLPATTIDELLHLDQMCSDEDIRGNLVRIF